MYTYTLNRFALFDELGLFSIPSVVLSLTYSPISLNYKIPKISKSIPFGPFADARFSFGGYVMFSMSLVPNEKAFDVNIGGQYSIGVSVSNIDKDIFIGGMSGHLRAGVTVGDSASLGIAGSVRIKQCPESIIGKVCIKGAAVSYIAVGGVASMKGSVFNVSVGAEIKGALTLEYSQCGVFAENGYTSQPAEMKLTLSANASLYLLSNKFNFSLGSTSSYLPSTWAPQIL